MLLLARNPEICMPEVSPHLAPPVDFASSGTWQKIGWGTPVQTHAITAVATAGIAGLPDGSSYLIELSAN